MHLSSYLELAERTSRHLAMALRSVAEAHPDDPETATTARILAGFSDRDADTLGPALARYAEHRGPDVDRLHPDPPGLARAGGAGLLRDLQDLYARASMADLNWAIVGQAARALRDESLVAAVESSRRDIARQLNWLLTRVRQIAPQILLMT